MQQNKRKEIALYIFFGAATTAINWAIYVVCVKYLFFSITLSNALAWLFAVIFAYITNKIYVFESRGLSLPRLIKEFFLFFGSRVVSGVLDIFLPTVLVLIGLNQAIFGVEAFLAKAISTAAVIIINYLLSKIIVFKKHG